MAAKYSRQFKYILALFHVLTVHHAGATPVQLILVNNCNETIWPGLQGGAGHVHPQGGGFRLDPAEESVFTVPEGWSGRIWPRRGCCFPSSGSSSSQTSSCDTGDCSGRLQCGGLGGTPPATVIEMTLGTSKSPLHYYDVSLVDGFNTPVSVAPVGGGVGCGVAACDVDLTPCCPAKFVVVSGDGRVVGCRSACAALGDDRHCCTGAYAGPDKCGPTVFSKMVKSVCPDAYSFAYDDKSSLKVCQASRYLVTFCPPQR